MSSVDQANSFLADIQERHSESGETPDSEFRSISTEQSQLIRKTRIATEATLQVETRTRMAKDMTETLHDPIVVDRVMCKLIELRSPLVDIDELTEDQLADWTAQAVEVINIVHDVPTEGVGFFDEIQHVDDYLEPWRDVLSANSDTLSVEDSPMILSVGGAGGGKTVERIGGDATDLTPHALISGHNGGTKRVESGLRLVAEVEDAK